jgi:hypothetical protein
MMHSLSSASDADVVAGLAKWVHSGRRVAAEILFHLAELEERRLHLRSGYNSLFAYCLAVHGMSEDEACRRIDVARLGRRFPAILELLASGALSLSVAALLKECLTHENHAALLAAVAGKSVRAAREELAARFPSPDVPSTIRKLPNRVVPEHGPREQAATPLLRASPESSNSTRDIAGKFESATPGSNRAEGHSASEQGHAEQTSAPGSNWAEGHSASEQGHAEQTSAAGCLGCLQGAGAPGELKSGAAIKADVTSLDLEEGQRIVQRVPQANPARTRIEPIAAARYRVQFTVTFAQKQKLEQALDLMAHRNPSRELGVVVERGTELLLEELLRQRAGATRLRATEQGASAAIGRATRGTVVEREGLQRAGATRPRATEQGASAAIGRATRRAVVERDGLQCSFVSEQGRRCEGRAFLEFDHRQPRGKGGDSRSGNVRMLCRAHNRYCAELEYGRAKIEREIDARSSAKWICGRRE